MHTRQPDSERVISARSLSIPASANAAAAREQLETALAFGPDLAVCLAERIIGVVPVESAIAAALL